MSKKKKHSVSDSQLNKLWRKAVLRKFHDRCAWCGTHVDQGVQCHHYIFRRHLILRWDYRNGIALCLDCHRFAHTKAGNQKVEDTLQDIDWLQEMEMRTFSAYASERGITNDEFRLEKKAELEAYIETGL